jgi:hypothetical protein
MQRLNRLGVGGARKFVIDPQHDVILIDQASVAGRPRPHTVVRFRARALLFIRIFIGPKSRNPAGPGAVNRAYDPEGHTTSCYAKTSPGHVRGRLCDIAHPSPVDDCPPPR